MKKVTVNGQLYLGDVQEKDGKITLKNSMAVGRRSVDRKTIGEYFKKKNLDELETIEFTGAGTAVSKREFTDEEQLIMGICDLAMTYAEKKGKGGMINQTFDEVLGKF